MKNLMCVATVLAVGGISFAANGAAAQDFMSNREKTVERTTIFDAMAASRKAAAEKTETAAAKKQAAPAKKTASRKSKSSAQKNVAQTARKPVQKKTASRSSKSSQVAKSETITRKSANGYALPGVAAKSAVEKPQLKKSVAKGRTPYSEIITRYAGQYGVPVGLAHAVVRVESNFNPKARGAAGEIGLMQIKPATARSIGFSGSNSALYEPETNIKYGMKYLAMAHKLGGGTTCGTILKYNAGHGAKRMNPVSANYCSKIKVHLASY
ncbi:lytic transglycosylase domain-containing protein [Limoniibacter endophyticus]|uniref:Transglycosylase SLT domain-containing protein n=1 Tax=Limoniibacter endophyticus TaxID=1565040 RepID=A0A8J3GGV5_9HYPH|nr:lytic transglycosylase domain-containing protein [Limoniibacter endophyticus]GHC75139.1 hypothetical protein GCM10010136_24630 [Limoniibacter endophyticus]